MPVRLLQGRQGYTSKQINVSKRTAEGPGGERRRAQPDLGARQHTVAEIRNTFRIAKKNIDRSKRMGGKSREDAWESYKAELLQNLTI
jgi:hypothetical protein